MANRSFQQAKVALQEFMDDTEISPEERSECYSQLTTMLQTWAQEQRISAGSGALNQQTTTQQHAGNKPQSGR